MSVVLEKVYLTNPGLKDLDQRKIPCKMCELKGKLNHLRFFVINQDTEIYKCGGRTCTFPCNNYIFRDRTQSKRLYRMMPTATSFVPQNTTDNSNGQKKSLSMNTIIKLHDEQQLSSSVSVPEDPVDNNSNGPEISSLNCNTITEIDYEEQLNSSVSVSEDLVQDISKVSEISTPIRTITKIDGKEQMNSSVTITVDLVDDEGQLSSAASDAVDFVGDKSKGQIMFLPMDSIIELGDEEQFNSSISVVEDHVENNSNVQQISSPISTIIKIGEEEPLCIPEPVAVDLVGGNSNGREQPCSSEEQHKSPVSVFEDNSNEQQISTPINTIINVDDKEQLDSSVSATVDPVEEIVRDLFPRESAPTVSDPVPVLPWDMPPLPVPRLPPAPFRPIPTTGEVIKVPLLVHLLKDLNSYQCKACESKNVTNYLRFFIINDDTEMFKCSGGNCMFPNRNYIFRNRQDQTYYRLKPVESAHSFAQSPPGFNMDDFNFSIDSSLKDDHDPNSTNFNSILDELFPDIESPSPETITNHYNSPEKTLTTSEVVSPPPKDSKVIVKTIEIISNRKKPTTKPASILPKKIKTPMELVMQLLKRKQPSNDTSTMENSLKLAGNLMQNVAPIVENGIRRPYRKSHWMPEVIQPQQHKSTAGEVVKVPPEKPSVRGEYSIEFISFDEESVNSPEKRGESPMKELPSLDDESVQLTVTEKSSERGRKSLIQSRIDESILKAPEDSGELISIDEESVQRPHKRKRKSTGNVEIEGLPSLDEEISVQVTFPEKSLERGQEPTAKVNIDEPILKVPETGPTAIPAKPLKSKRKASSGRSEMDAPVLKMPESISNIGSDVEELPFINEESAQVTVPKRSLNRGRQPQFIENHCGSIKNIQETEPRSGELPPENQESVHVSDSKKPVNRRKSQITIKVDESIPNVPETGSSVNAEEMEEESVKVAIAQIPRKRGRPPRMKVKTVNTEIPKVPETVDECQLLDKESQEVSLTEPPRKRGRPPKIKLEIDESIPNVPESISNTDDDVEIPSLDDEGSVHASLPEPPRKRGRPPKMKVKVDVEIPKVPETVSNLDSHIDECQLLDKESQEVSLTEPPRKRGRPPKIRKIERMKSDEQSQITETNSTNNTPSKSARNSITLESDFSSDESAPRRKSQRIDSIIKKLDESLESPRKKSR